MNSLEMTRLRTMLAILFVAVCSQVLCADIKKDLKNKLYQTSRFPRVLHNVLMDNRPFQHVVYLNKKNEVTHPKKKGTKTKKNEIVHVKKNGINRMTSNKQSSHKNNKIRKRTFLETQVRPSTDVESTG